MNHDDLTDLTDLELLDELVEAEANLRYFLERAESAKARIADLRREQNAR